MKQIGMFLMAVLMAAQADAQSVGATWSLSDPDNLDAVTMTGQTDTVAMVSTAFAVGNNLTVAGALTETGVDTTYAREAAIYDPVMMKFQPTVQVSAQTTGHNLEYSITVAEGHTFQPTLISFDAARCGTNAGSVLVTAQQGSKAEMALSSFTPQRNKLQTDSPQGYTAYSETVSKVCLEGGTTYTVRLYVLGIATTKQMAFRNLHVEGLVDAPYEEPVTGRRDHGTATPLNRGLLAMKVSGGVLVSWRIRSYDDEGTTYRLHCGSNGVATLTDKSNYLDASGTTSTTYTLEVLDADGNVTETQTTTPWSGQNHTIALQKAPTDTKGTGATYTPNDAQCYDMDGDGEQEIVFKWEPSNVKDAAGNAATGAVWLECVKLDGTQLWRINLGQNIWASQHTVSFLCYDFDGDGFGEMICKTAPGTIDGEGNYVLLDGDDPTANYGNNQKPTGGPEYLTVFDGTTGGEISTINYWPAYRDGKSYGDSNNNRAFRFNSTLAYLDVDGVPTPCAVMNRGYYNQAYYQAAYYDGEALKQLWRAEFTTSGQGMYGEGYHTLQSGDVDGDGFDEIIAGSAVMDHDGKCLWRSGDGHGDALHVGDFVWDNDGLEIFSVKESKTGTYDCTMRDARTGKLLWGCKQTGGDTGRGLCGDFDERHPGAEAFHSSSASMYDAKGQTICNWQQGTVSSSSINFRIYWNGDLYDDYHDRQHVDVWDASAQSFGRAITLYNVTPGASSCNDSKYVPNLQADILGDWREEVVYWYTVDADNGLYGLNLIATNLESAYGLPYLRDDALYDRAIAWQNSTYNQPPHLGYSPALLYSGTIRADEESKYMFVPYYTDRVQICPDGVEVYYVPSYSSLTEGQDTVCLKQFTAGYLPATKAVLLRVPDLQTYYALITSTSVNSFSTDYLYGQSEEFTVANGTPLSATSKKNYYYYEFRHDAALGYGFYLIPEGEQTYPAHYALLRVQANPSTTTIRECYLLGTPWNDDQTAAIRTINAAAGEADLIRDLTGRTSTTLEGLRIVGGRVVLKK